MSKDKLTKEETELALSAKDAHNLIEMCNTNGWKVLKEMYFDVRLKECREYIDDINNTDMATIQGKRLLLEFIHNMLDDIKFTVEVGLQNEEELVKRKEKKKK